MSRGSQRQFSESIYNLVPQPVQQKPKQKRYVSQFPPDTQPTASTFGPSVGSSAMTTNMNGDYAIEPRSHAHRQNGATFGRQSDHYSDPTNFLKKSAKGALQEPQAFKYRDTIKPQVVKRSEKPTMGRRSQTNYIRENQVAAICSEPKKKNIEAARYRNKPDFGKVPEYLGQVKAEIAAEKEYINEQMEMQRQYYERPQDQMTMLAESERVELLAKLKDKWESINCKYQKCTHVVTLDTVGKIRRKEDHESQLQQLEQSIQKLDKKFVFVQQPTQQYAY